MLSIKSAPSSYGKKAFFNDYPNNNSDEGKIIKLGFFNNVRLNEDRIKLKAFRNMLLSTPVGIFALIIGIFIKVYTEKRQ